MEWVVAAQDSSVGEAGKASAQENLLPEGVSITTGTPGKDESELLLSGEVDALFHAATPAAYRLQDRLNLATDMLPWYSQEVDNTRALMGANYYPYGMEAGQKTVEALFRYSYNQGLANRILTVEETFLPESLFFSETT